MFLQAANYTPGRTAKVRLVVIHDMEAPQGLETAENVAAWFHSQPQDGHGTSAHLCVDVNSVVDCVRDTDTAWAAPGMNADGVHIEHAGYAAWTSDQWQTADSKAMLDLSANRAAQLCIKYGLAIRHLSDLELADGTSTGFVGHMDGTRVLNNGIGHIDPGPGWPWAYYLARVSAYYAAQTGPVIVPSIKIGNQMLYITTAGKQARAVNSNGQVGAILGSAAWSAANHLAAAGGAVIADLSAADYASYVANGTF